MMTHCPFWLDIDLDLVVSWVSATLIELAYFLPR